MILIIKHVLHEGPGTIESFFQRHGFLMKTLELSQGANLSPETNDLEAVISMGGPMNVYEEDKYPFLHNEDVFIKRIVREEIPFLGICLGSQLLAKACQAKVTRAPRKEIGWFPVELTREGKTDPLFKDLDNPFDVFQWHGDTFAIPRNGKHLACAPDCLHQALKVGPCAYGLQFHIEVTEDIIEDWVNKDFKDKTGKINSEGRKILDEYPKLQKSFDRNAEIIYRNFLEIMSKSKVGTGFKPVPT